MTWIKAYIAVSIFWKISCAQVDVKIERKPLMVTCQPVDISNCDDSLPRPALLDSLWPIPQSMDVSESTIPECLSKEEKNDRRNRREHPYTQVNFQLQHDEMNMSKILEERFCERMNSVLSKWPSTPIPSYSKSLAVDIIDIEVSDCSRDICKDNIGYYELNFDAMKGTVQIRSLTRAGFVYGLETLTQMLSADMSKVNTVDLIDFPLFPEWRGISMDTARHFLPVGAMLHTLSTMSSNKMNILHWHLTDSTSFPLQLASVPELSEHGAFSPEHKYSQSDIQKVIEAANNLSIEIVPEIDMPAHTHSWKRGAENIVLDCPTVLPNNINDESNVFKKMDLSVLDVSREDTFTIVENVLVEVALIFPGKYFHVGFDEVDYRCWNSNHAFVEWKRKKGFSNEDVVAYFFSRVFGILEKLGKIPIVWQDLYETLGKALPKNTIIQTWKCWPDSGTYGQHLGHFLAEKATREGYNVVQSTCLYLDWDSQWTDIYGHGPMDNSGLMLGGEAALWTERIDFTNFDCRLWPRTSCVADTLWNPRRLNANSLKKISENLLNHANRMQWLDQVQLTMKNEVDSYTLHEMNNIQITCPLLEMQSIQRPLDECPAKYK